MISNIARTLALTAAKEGLKDKGIAVVIRNALLSAGVSFAATKALEKADKAIEQSSSSKTSSRDEKYLFFT